MELKIFSPSDEGYPQKIEWNFPELKEELKDRVEQYKGLEYTEAQIKEARFDKARLNNLKNAIEDKRKEIKAQCLKPYEQFEKEVKELLAIINEPVQLIDKQIKEYEAGVKKEKKAELLKFYQEVIENFGDILPFEKVWKKEYENLSKSMKSCKKEIADLIAKVKNDLFLIESANSPYVFEMRKVYIESLDMSVAFAVQEKLEKEAIEKASFAKMKSEKSAKQQLDGSQKVVAQKEPPKDKMKDAKEDNNKGSSEQSEKVFFVDFRVYGTSTQIDALKQYLKDNELKYGKAGADLWQ